MMDDKINKDSHNNKYYGNKKLSMSPNQRLIGLKMSILEQG